MGGIGEFNIILALGVLLAAGFAGAWLVRIFHLPSVIGYILTGILLGPSGPHLWRNCGGNCPSDYHGGLHIEDESLAKFAPAERPRSLRPQVEYLAELVADFAPRLYWMS